MAITTWASFASMWLIPRLEDFQNLHPDIDIRIDTSDTIVDLEMSDADIALRSSQPSLGRVAPHGVRMFGEQLAPVASPWLLKGGKTLQSAADLARFTLIEAGDVRNRNFVILAWAVLARQAQGAPPAAQTLAVFRLCLPDGAGGHCRPGRGAGAHAADRRSTGERRLIEVLPGKTHRLAAVLLADDSARAWHHAQIVAFCAWLDTQVLAHTPGHWRKTPRRRLPAHRRRHRVCRPTRRRAGAEPRSRTRLRGCCAAHRRAFTLVETAPFLFRIASSAMSWAWGSRSAENPA